MFLIVHSTKIVQTVLLRYQNKMATRVRNIFKWHLTLISQMSLIFPSTKIVQMILLL